jgi:hypothetical protein
VQPRWRRLRPRTWKGWALYGFAALLILGALLGEEDQPRSVPASEVASEQSLDNEPSTQEDEAAQELVLQEERERLREARLELRRERAQLRRQRVRARQARIAARRERERQEQLAQEAAPPPEPKPVPEASCHPSYDPCLDPNASDYDCDGGSGDGPEYTGFVNVKGPDDYGLDSDGDGMGCET